MELKKFNNVFKDRYFQRVYCKVCGKLFWKPKKASKGKKGKLSGLRPFSATTCSRECSRLNTDIGGNRNTERLKAFRKKQHEKESDNKEVYS